MTRPRYTQTLDPHAGSDLVITPGDPRPSHTLTAKAEGTYLVRPLYATAAAELPGESRNALYRFLDRARSVHHAGRGEALGVEGHKGARLPRVGSGGIN